MTTTIKTHISEVSRDIENQMKKTMENDIETEIIAFMIY